MTRDYRFIKYQVQHLRPGLQVGETVLSSDGKILLDSGTILTDKHIERFASYDIRSIIIREANQLEEAPDDSATLQTGCVDTEPTCEPDDMPANVYEQEREVLLLYNETVKDLKKCFTAVRLDNHLDFDLLNSIVCSIRRLSAMGISITPVLNTVVRSEDYLFYHSVNVGILACLIGELSGEYTSSQQQYLALAGILHDIGKVKIPIQILNKNGQLTDEEFNMVKQHPAIAYKFFRNYKDVPEIVSIGVLQHHERGDGSGYPLHTPDTKIHPFAKVLGIADIYDAMTSKKVYGAEVSPFAAIDALQGDTFSGKLSAKFSTPFLNALCTTLIGRYITLSDGRNGQLVFWNRDGKGTCLVRFSDNRVIDISSNNNLKITKVIC